MWQIMVALAGSYLLGSIPTAYVLVRWVKRIDVRAVGSGNVGATNAARAAGPGIGIIVFLIDALKGAIAILVFSQCLPSWSAARLICGLAAVIGHNFPVFLKFRGGKGVATTIGVLLAAMPPVAAVCLLIWLCIFLVSRYVSFASLAAAVSLPILQILGRQSSAERIIGAILVVLIIARHHGNIQRLLQGKEHRIGSARH